MVRVPAAHKKALRKLAREKKVSESEIVRELLAKKLGKA